MSINFAPMLILLTRSHKYHPALLLQCLSICFIFILPVFGDIEAVPGQSLEGQLDLLVNAPAAAQITITPPANISGWYINPDVTNQVNGILNVQANQNRWQVTAKDSDSATSGFMTEWTGSAYGPLKLTNHMKVKAANEVILPNEGVIQTGSKTPGHGQDINVIFTQSGSYLDYSLPAGRVYRIVVTFTGSYY